MYSATGSVDKRPLKVDSQDFGPRFLRRVLLRDVQGDSRRRTGSVVGAGSDGRGEKRSRAKLRYLPGHRRKRIARPFHEVTSASAVDMNVQESGNGRFIGRRHFPGAGGQVQAVPRPDGLDNVVAD